MSENEKTIQQGKDREPKTIKNPERPNIGAMLEEELEKLDHEVTLFVADAGTLMLPSGDGMDLGRMKTIAKETTERLTANEAAMRDAIELARRSIDAHLEEQRATETAPTAESQAGTVEMVVDNGAMSLEKRLSQFMLDAKAMSSEERVATLTPMLKENPLLADVMTDAGFSQPERIAVLEGLRQDSPEKFLTAAWSCNQKYETAQKIEFAVTFADIDPALFERTVALLRMTQEQTQKALETLPEGLRPAVLEKMAVPNIHGATTVSGEFPIAEAGMEFHAEEREAAMLRIGELERVSADLSDALIEAFPERARREREHRRKEEILRGPILSHGELGGGSATAPRFLLLEGSPLPAVYKLPKFESKLNENGQVVKIISSIDAGEMAWREPLSSLIDRALDLGIVPVTVMRDGPEGPGSVQEWRIGKIAFAAGEARISAAKMELLKLALLDLITNACDRHDSNYMLDPNEKIIAIDNGAVFPRRVIKADGVRSDALRRMKGEPIPAELRDAVVQLLGEPKVMEMLRKGFEASLKNDAPAAWDYFTDKLEAIAADENWVFPDTEWYKNEELDLFHPIAQAI